mmetsp:Transcript_22124/g.71439  ORF Transcript_22124/g.71439 Transcript_22124/m.71439 type:complete len:210 (-) Transcript_22124:8-637(-)
MLLPDDGTRVANVCNHQLPILYVGCDGSGARHGVVKVLLVHLDVASHKRLGVRALQVVPVLVHRVGEPRLERVPHKSRANVALCAVAVEDAGEEGGAVAAKGRLDAEGVLVVLVQVVRIVPSLRHVCIPQRDASIAQAVGQRLLARLNTCIHLFLCQRLVRLRFCSLLSQHTVPWVVSGALRFGLTAAHGLDTRVDRPLWPGLLVLPIG